MPDQPTDAAPPTPLDVAPASTPPESTPRAFTQDEVNALLAKQKREQFGDYGDLKAKAAKLTEFEEAQRTEAEKAAARAAAAEQDRDSARAESLRYKAAATHGIGEDYFDLLGNGDEPTITARAERVGGLLRDNAAMKAELDALRAGKPAPTNGRPTEQLKPGATPESTQTEDDVLYNSIFGT